jgi:hypothetical protein
MLTKHFRSELFDDSGNNNEKLGLPERLSAGMQFRFRNLFHGKVSGNRNFIC